MDIFNLFIIYIITILESVYAFNTNTRIVINTDILFIKGKGNLFEVIINEFSAVVSSIVSILLLTIPFYTDDKYSSTYLNIIIYFLIYCLILIVYIKLRWINKNLNNI